MGKIATTADVLEAQQKEQKVMSTILFLIHSWLKFIFWACVYVCVCSFVSFFFFIYFVLQSFHAELHQYKYHVELFNQLTQKLIAVYPSDDTTRIKRMTEGVNIRYEQNAIIHLIYQWQININLRKQNPAFIANQFRFLLVYIDTQV